MVFKTVSLHGKKDKLSKFQFYLHIIEDGEKRDNVLVAQADNHDKYVPDPLWWSCGDPMIVAPKYDLKTIGRAQGMVASVSQQELDFIMMLNLVFTDGAYNGSTLRIHGHDREVDKYHELPVVGGPGIFRLATGSAICRDYSMDVVLEFNVIVMHY